MSCWRAEKKDRGKGLVALPTDPIFREGTERDFDLTNSRFNRVGRGGAAMRGGAFGGGGGESQIL